MTCEREQLDAVGEAFARRLLCLGPELMRLAMAVLNDAFLAEDAVAGTYLKAWKQRRTLRDDAKLNSWLKRICRNEAIDLRRRRGRGETTLGGCDIDLPAPREDEFDERQLRADLLRRLPDSLKVCARMFLFEGRGQSEIAAIEGLPLSTVRGRIYQARRHLRKEIDMVTKPTGPRQDEYDDGTIRAMPGQTVPWRGMRIRFLGLGWYGQKTLYDGAGKRLSRTPAIVRKGELFGGRRHCALADDGSPCLWAFWQISGKVTGLVGTSVHPPVPNSSSTFREDIDGKRLICGLATIPPGGGRWVDVGAMVMGDVLRGEASCERFDFNLSKSFVATSRPGWGALCLFTARRGKLKGTSEVSLAYSSPKAEDTWAVLALDKAGREVESCGMSMANSFCAEGRVAGVTLQYALPPSQLAGVVFRPRPRVRIKYGRLRLPPRASQR